MKFTTIAKASLAIGILATGAITSTSQSAHAKSAVTQQSESDLKLYYNGPSFEYKKVTGFKYTDEKGSFFEFIDKGQFNKISLLGSDKNKFEEGENSNLDVFVVREGAGRQAANYSIGGVTKTNSVQYIDYINAPLLEIKNGDKEPQRDFYYISKEDISLKELDFKLRKQLISQSGLYSNGLKQGQITITMKDGKSHTIDLSKKLEKERMGDSIDGTQIQKIQVEIR
ncbi:exotoxin beta-grasp domain-containing protein [Staphylococcus argenteus]|uniref:exotoxin beta-grasp domain-containing protein n=1 Tax=Staphylococcus argenteus TaxID=985002 RepID=UPI001FBAD6DD|nr:superantigen-like protein [Staphylococcus argenteus]MCG9795726.1 superantigen-like protein [Staphylococcus argenteus]GJF44957.1 superantigen-like protein SSL1 [Staphylococcus argenteus]GJF53669.1 superantigen-like protein SSL1 [Staphylococcus argenteus]GJF60153.1 superantigen-like protein SSL1 [Staphylococcus argenteus]GJF73309.1 superantigen-like protein SSL1 [Staphylococcus argenteus]